MTKDERAKLIEEAITLVIDSLISHLPYTHTPNEDGRAFHKKTVSEYSRLLVLLSRLY